MRCAKMVALWCALAVGVLAAAGCAATYALQNEFIFPNAAEGPMARPVPPGATQYWRSVELRPTPEVQVEGKIAAGFRTLSLKPETGRPSPIVASHAGSCWVTQWAPPPFS